MLITLLSCTFLGTETAPDFRPHVSLDTPTESSSETLKPIEQDTPLRSNSMPEKSSAKVEIHDWPLPNEPRRQELTIAYLEKHCTGCRFTGDIERDTRMTPKVVVLHWTAGPSMKSTHRYFSSPTLSGRKRLKKEGDLNVGAHFLVDRDGSIYRLADETRILRHVIGLNHLSIGVENVGGGDKWPLTEAQVTANMELVRYLVDKHPITHLIGHYEYRGLEGHPYFDEKDPKYRTRKSDPGVRFMRLVRQGLADLNLKSPSR